MFAQPQVIYLFDWFYINSSKEQHKYVLWFSDRNSC